MRTSNLANQATRQSEVGHVWVELLTNTSGTLEIPKYATFRVRANAAVTITMDGILAATMASGEVLLFNTGSGSNDSSGNLVPTVTVVVTGNCYLQVARDKDR